MEHLEIVVKQEFNCSAETLWKAITDPVEMRQWYFAMIPDFKAQIGFETRFNVEAPSRDFLHIWRVTEVDPGRMITYTWEFEGLSGKGVTVFSVEGDDNRSKLTLVNTGVESFPREYPEFTEESCRGGWKYFINESLNKYLSDKSG